MIHSITARLKLTEFIDTEIESWVIDRVNEIYKIRQFKLHFWYDESTITKRKTKSFVKSEKQLHFRTKITPACSGQGFRLV